MHLLNLLQSESQRLNASGTANSIASYSQRRKLAVFEGKASIKRSESLDFHGGNSNSKVSIRANLFLNARFQSAKSIVKF